MHKEVKWYTKAFLLLILVYAISPIDLIPDFIPIIGMLDDLVLIPMGIVIAIKIIPANIWKECKEKAEQGVVIDNKFKRIGVMLITLIWVVVLVSILRRIFI